MSFLQGIIRLYDIPSNTFESDDSSEEESDEDEDADGKSFIISR